MPVMAAKNKNDPQFWEDMLKKRGVEFKGYGVVPKYAMRDPDLSLTAKGIYAYFCAMSGSGNSTYPSAERVRSDLGLGKKAYYDHRKQLVDQGYIAISSMARERGEFATNLFTIVSNPKKFSAIHPKNDWQSEVFMTIENEGLKAAGYGIIYRSVVQDPRMDIKAKAVYAYFASYAGAGRSAIPPVPQILQDLGISEPTYHKAMKKLRELGYIEVQQINWGEKGRRGFGANRYILSDCPIVTEQKISHPKKADTVKSDMVDAYTEESDMAESSVVNVTTINNSFFSTNTFSSNSIHPSINIVRPPERMDRSDPYKETNYESTIKENVEYQRFSQLLDPMYIGKAKELTLLMITTCESSGKNVSIGGEDIPIEKVRNRFLNMNIEHLEYVIRSVEQYEGSIRNPRAYCLAALYHASETLESHLANEEKKDF